MAEIIPPPETGTAPATALADVDVFTHKGLHERRNASEIRGHDFRQSGFLAPSEQ